MSIAKKKHTHFTTFVCVITLLIDLVYVTKIFFVLHYNYSLLIIVFAREMAQQRLLFFIKVDNMTNV